MSQFDRQYQHSQKLVAQLQHSMSQLEQSLRTSPHKDIVGAHLRRVSGELQSEVKQRLAELSEECEKLQISCNKEPMSRRMKAKAKIQQIFADTSDLQKSFERLLGNHEEKKKQEKERQELLSTKFQVNDSVNSFLYQDGLLKEGSSLRNSTRHVDQLLSQGAYILQDLQQQRFTLKGTKKKLLDIANTLGLSNTVMRFIEKRTSQDQWILWGGMLATLLLMYTIWYYFRVPPSP